MGTMALVLPLQHPHSTNPCMQITKPRSPSCGIDLKFNPVTDADSNMYAHLLEDCANHKSLSGGQQLHARLFINGFDQNLCTATKLVKMYAMCGNLADARLVFDKLSQRNVILWNSMIRGYLRNELWEETLDLYYQMQREGIQPDSFIFPCVLKACGNLKALQQGKEIHDDIIRNGFELDAFLGSSLADMYSKCGSLDCARQVFDKISQRNVVVWNSMIAGYIHNGSHNEALKIFRQMQLQGVKPNTVTIINVIPACALLQVKEIYGYITRSGFDSDICLWNAVVGKYAKCGSIEMARHVFDKMPQRSVVSWNTMVAGYAQNGCATEALKLFCQMILAGVKADPVGISSILPACSHLRALEQGKEIHGYILRRGFASDVYVESGLIDMYAKCGFVDVARQVFDKMTKRSVVAWTAIVAGYAQNRHANAALKLFRRMQCEGVTPNSLSIASVLPACVHLGALQQGIAIHAYIIRRGFELDPFVGSALLDMYVKCGNIEAAHQVFDNMPHKNIVSWTGMIAGCGMHGHGEDALSHFCQMQQVGVKPDHITFVALLSACSHAGLLDEGWQYFNNMSQDYGITPRVEHYACMVDLLGRAGLLDEAYNFILKMPLEPEASVWGALLGACRIHQNTKLAECVAKILVELEPTNTGNYVLLSNIYASSGRWSDVANVRAMMKERGLQKSPGCSWIEVKSRVHAFLVGDRLHPQSEQIYAMLESLSGQMKAAGYVPDMDCILHDVQGDEKEHMLSTHSEKLAIAFGLINTCPGMPIRITKNLRVCGDCHTATKFISKIALRTIIVRDANRFHHFKNGLCSCGDYW